jgi:hypothetical protein
MDVDSLPDEPAFAARANGPKIQLELDALRC